MNDGASGIRGHGRDRPAAARATVLLIAAVGLALLAAACGSSGSRVAQLRSTTTESVGSPIGAASTQVSGAVAFAGCMRSHRVPNWPDPTSSGAFDKSKLTPQQLGASSSQIQAAQSACRHLLPGGAGPPSPARVQQIRAEALRFSECVRAHGVPSFPDPGSDGRIPDPASVGVDQGSPKFESANDACGKYRPPYMPSNAAYNAYARTHG